MPHNLNDLCKYRYEQGKAGPKIITEVDYEDFYIVSKDTAKEQIENSGKFVKEIKRYLENAYNISL